MWLERRADNFLLHSRLHISPRAGKPVSRVFSCHNHHAVSLSRTPITLGLLRSCLCSIEVPQGAAVVCGIGAYNSVARAQRGQRFFGPGSVYLTENRQPSILPHLILWHVRHETTDTFLVQLVLTKRKPRKDLPDFEKKDSTVPARAGSAAFCDGLGCSDVRRRFSSRFC